jgi:hypothetical protein
MSSWKSTKRTKVTLHLIICIGTTSNRNNSRMQSRGGKNDPGQSTNANKSIGENMFLDIEENKLFNIISKEIDNEGKNVDPEPQYKTAFSKSINI